MLDPNKPFVIEVDASKVRLGEVLSQRHRTLEQLNPCTFFSHKLSPVECNYHIGNCELLTVKAALEEWKEPDTHLLCLLTTKILNIFDRLSI